MIGRLVQGVRGLFTQSLTTIEKFTIVETARDYLCRVDLGAHTCSLHAKDIAIDQRTNTVTFRHAGITYDLPLLRYKSVRNAHGAMMRARVALTYVWKGRTFKNIETSLVDRSKLHYELLIGRNLVREIGLPIRLSPYEVIE